MRTVSSTIENSLSLPGHSNRVKIYLQPNLIMMEDFDDNAAVSFANDAGYIDSPIPEDISYSASGSGVVSFFNHEGALKYALQGDATPVTISGITISGKPGVYGNYLFTVESGTVHRRQINYTSIDSKSTSPLSGDASIGAITGTECAVHAVSDTRCVVVYYDDGGYRAVLFELDGTWKSYVQHRRFMFPHFADNSRVSERTTAGMVLSSAASELNDDVYCYVSNALTGHVEGIKWDNDIKIWGDIFITIPTDLDVSLCELRITKSFVVDNTMYLVGQFIRTDIVEASTTYCMISRSKDGKIFTSDRLSVVSNLNYRMLGLVADNNLYISSCNRVAYSDVTYVYSPVSGSANYTLDITNIQNKIPKFSLNDFDSGSIQILDASLSFIDHAWMDVGARILVKVGFLTSAGWEDLDYGSYIIEKANPDYEKQSLTLTLRSESSFALDRFSSPYYAEIISKSSVWTNFDEQGDLYTAGSGGFSENLFSVEFWDAEGYTADGVTPVEISSSGGLDSFTIAGSHAKGIATIDLDEALGSKGYPRATATTIHTKIYGWSRDDRSSGSNNDDVEIRLIMVKPDGTEYEATQSGSKFPNTYPDSATGDFPIEYDVTVAVDDRIKQIALVYSCDNATEFYVHRVEVTSGIIVDYNYKANTPWETVDDGLLLPEHRRPFIMFAQKPYDANSFIISSQFSNTYEAGITGHPVAFGLVGLAMDASNYIVGRYDKTSNKFQIIKVSQRVESLLVEQTPTTTVGQTAIIQFEYKDGHFSLRMNISGEWIEQANYDWTADDAYMTLDHITATKVGIYGLVDVPFFRITGYSPSASEKIPAPAGIPVLPGYNTYADFPASGKVQLGENVYNYTTKGTVTEIRGPSQLRQYGLYIPPFGDGYGLECRDFDWTKTAGSLTGMFAAVDSGRVYLISSEKWNVYITTAGQVVDLIDRARYYSENQQIGRDIHSLYHKVYATFGLSGVSLNQGETVRHAWGTEARYYMEGEIVCNWFYGSSGNQDATVRDLVDMIAKVSGAEVNFTGDISYPTLTLTSGSGNIGTQTYRDSLDIYFSFDQLGNGEYVEVVTDTSGSGDDTQTSVRLTAEGTSGDYLIELYSLPSAGVIDSFTVTSGSANHDCRVLYHGDFITVNLDNRWAYTFCLASLVYENTIDIDIKSNVSSLELTNVLLTELSDWREAIYIDLDTDGMSALKSILQERPVEISSKYDGTINCSYGLIRETVTTLCEIRSFSNMRSFPDRSTSDAIIYADEVSTIQYAPYLREFGFSTKIVRMPNLTIGAVNAAKINLQRALERKDMYSLSKRPDPRIEIGDKLYFDFTFAGVGKNIEKTIIVEGISFRYSTDTIDIEIKGRGAL